MFDPVVPYLLIVTAFAALSVKMAFSDMTALRISNRDVLALFILYPVYLSFAVNAPDIAWAFGIAGVVLIIGFALFALKIIGAGDAKMLSVIALWAGPEMISTTLMIIGVSGGALALFMMSRFQFEVAALASRYGAISFSNAIETRQLPYGVAIAAGGGFVAYRLFSVIWA